MKPLLLAALLLLALPAAAQTPIASPGHPGWTRTAEGCFVWNGMPQNGERVSWSGACVDGRASGRGVLLFHANDGTQQHDAEMRNGKLNGRSKSLFQNGNRYDGEWHEGERHGQGVQVWADGSHYEGEWRDGKFSGRGIFTWKNGSSFDGEWRDAKPNGLGRMVWANGTIYSGIWTNGCFRDGGRRAWVMVDKSTCP